MEEHLQVRPNLLKMRLTRHLHHAVQHRQHPRGHATDVGDILIHGLTGYTLTLYLEVREQCRLLLWHTNQVDQRIDVLNQNGTKVAHQRARHIVIRCMTATKDETLAVEHPRLGVITEIERHRVTATSIMNLLETVTTDRNKLRLVICRTARLGVPLHTARPQDVSLAVTHTVDIAFQLLVSVDGIISHEIIVAPGC